MDKLKVQSISPKEQQELMDRAERALGALRIMRDCSLRDHGENDFANMLQGAIDIFSEMRTQWAMAIGNPQEISGETIQKIVDRTSDVLKDVLKAQIAAGKF